MSPAVWPIIFMMSSARASESGRADMTHVCDLASVLGEERAVRHLRGQLPHYLRGYRGAARIRELIHQAETLAQVAEIFADARERLHIEPVPALYSCPEA